MKTFIGLLIIMFMTAACDNASAGGGNVDSNDNSIIGGASVKISGAVDLDIPNGEAFFVELEGTAFLRHMIEIGDTNEGYLVRIVFTGEPASGTFPIMGELGAEQDVEQAFSAGLVYLLSPDPEQQFRNNPQGTVTIEADGETLSGSIEFSATNASGEGTVTVSGVFDEIAREGSSNEF